MLVEQLPELSPQVFAAEFQQDKTSVLYYVHKEFYDGDRTICGPITYSVTAKKSDGSTLPGAVIRYTKNLFMWSVAN
jgi:hypothetical protein